MKPKLIRQYAHDYNIPLYGSWYPTCIKGLMRPTFRWPALQGCGISLFPGAGAGCCAAPFDLSVTPRTTLPVDGGEC
ncbi:MAG: hypothetical protein ACLTMA_06170 [Gemmiger formicilis]|uniref:hypothetical protein n=1 Tax=Gemmiger formicilis TaxID=745368 RepID=UPI003A2F949F